MAIRRMSDAELDAIIASSPEGAEWWHARTDPELEQMARSGTYPAHVRPTAKDGSI